MPYLVLVLVMTLGSVGAGGYFYVTNLQADLAQARLEASTYKAATETQQNTIDQLQTSIVTQGQELNRLTTANGEIQQEMNRYLSIFKRHNLSKLADAKPGLIETRVNNGTREVFESIKSDTTIE